MHHRMCDDIFKEIKKKKKGDNKHIYTCTVAGFKDQPSQMWLISITQLLCNISTSVADAAHLM